jgi:hypothetical protein
MKRPLTFEQYQQAGMTHDEAERTLRYDEAMHTIADHIVMTHDDAEWRRSMLNDCVDALYERVESAVDGGAAESTH